MAQRGRSERLQTPIYRLSFPALITPQPPNRKKPDFKTWFQTMLFEEGEDLRAMKMAAHEAAVMRWGKNIPANLRNPFRDGKVKEHLDGYEEGMTFVYAASHSKIGVVGPDVDPVTGKPRLITLDSEVYAGCYCHAFVNAYTYEGDGAPGVTFGLLSVQKVKDGDSFGARSNAEEDYEGVASEDKKWDGDDSEAEGIFG